jgi:hypothetical protein
VGCKQGCGQAGNKSMLGYRAGFGVPGYTGYIPSKESFQLPIKHGLSERLAIDTTPGNLSRTLPPPIKQVASGPYLSLYQVPARFCMH